MLELLHDRLPLVVAVVCLVPLLASWQHAAFYVNSNFSRIVGRRPAGAGAGNTGRTTTTTPSAPQLEGDGLYYDRARWPQYEPRFNLRLSYLHGAVVTVTLSPPGRVRRALRWLNGFLYSALWDRAWRRSDTTVLINSLSDDGDGSGVTLRRLLNSCASRATSIPAGKYLSGGRRIVLQPYGPGWTRHRRAFAALLTGDRVRGQWAGALRFEALVMVERISRLSHIGDDAADAASGAAVLDEVSRFTASSVLQIAYGKRAETPREPVLRDLEVVSRNIGSAFAPGKYWVEDFPLLDVLPLAVSPWKRELMANHEFERGVFRRLLGEVEQRLRVASVCSGPGLKLEKSEASSTRSAHMAPVIPAEECAAAQLLCEREHLQLDRDDVAYLAAGMFEAGTETTAMTINTFLIAAACYPDMVRRAQEELDGYVLRDRDADADAGDGDAESAVVRLPTFDDLRKLPYLGAVVKEALRLTPTGSSGVGHTSATGQGQTLGLGVGTRQLELQVPSGATILGNIYGLHHDTERFPNPWRFSPDRWLEPSTSTCSPENEQKPPPQARQSLDHSHATFAFGFGRRICPGSTLASYSLSMSIAMLVLCFDFDMTNEALAVCKEMEALERETDEKWTALHPNDGGRRALEREKAAREGYEDERDRIGRVLIDSYSTFRLQRSRLSGCFRVRPRARGGYGLRAAREELSAIKY